MTNRRGERFPSYTLACLAAGLLLGGCAAQPAQLVQPVQPVQSAARPAATPMPGPQGAVARQKAAKPTSLATTAWSGRRKPRPSRCCKAAHGAWASATPAVPRHHGLQPATPHARHHLRQGRMGSPWLAAGRRRGAVLLCRRQQRMAGRAEREGRQAGVRVQGHDQGPQHPRRRTRQVPAQPPKVLDRAGFRQVRAGSACCRSPRQARSCGR